MVHISLGRWAHLRPHVHCGFHASSACALMHVCVCVRACVCVYASGSVFCENNSWQWVSEMWWPSTGSLEFCQYGGPALIIKNTFTGRISAASVVGSSLQGHIEDNRTEKKFGNIAQEKIPKIAQCCAERSSQGISAKHLFPPQLLYFVFVIDSRCLVCSFPPNIWSFFVQDNEKSKRRLRNSLRRKDLHSQNQGTKINNWIGVVLADLISQQSLVRIQRV